MVDKRILKENGGTEKRKLGRGKKLTANIILLMFIIGLAGCGVITEELGESTDDTEIVQEDNVTDEDSVTEGIEEEKDTESREEANQDLPSEAENESESQVYIDIDLIKIWYDADGNIRGRYGYSHDSQETKTRYVQYGGRTYDWFDYVHDGQYVVTGYVSYAADGNIGAYEYDDYDRAQYVYDTEGRLSEQIYYDNDHELFRFEYSYEYDESENMEIAHKIIFRESEEIYSGVVQSGDGVYEYDYDSQENVIKRSHHGEMSEFEMTETDLWTEYSYDDQNNLIKKAWYYGDGSLLQWTEYRYDDEGRQAKEVWYDNNDNIVGWEDFYWDEQMEEAGFDSQTKLMDAIEYYDGEGEDNQTDDGKSKQDHKDGEWKKAYKEFMETSPEMAEWREVYVDMQSESEIAHLGYVDDDEVPELFLKAETARNYVSMYTYRDGKVMSVTGDNGFLYREKSNILESVYAGQASNTDITIYEFTDGELVPAGYSYYMPINPPDSFGYCAAYNGEQISKEEFSSRIYNQEYTSVDSSSFMTLDEIYAILDN